MTAKLSLPFGRTPLADILVTYRGCSHTFSLKLEQFNPCGSMKDRTALALMNSLAPHLEKKSRVIESTSGNLGVALAAICATFGVPLTTVVDPRTSRSLIQKMEHLGADVVVIDAQDPDGGYLLNRLNYVEDCIARDPDLIWTNQYRNPGNPGGHYNGTAPEVKSQCAEPASVLVPVSTGGTLKGFKDYAADNGLPWKIIGVDVPGSAAVGGAAGERILAGIGASCVSNFLVVGEVDVVYVTPEDAVSTCLWLLEKTGLAVGGSSGAAIAAAYQLAENENESTNYVCICPDGGDRYLETIYCEEWRSRNDLRTEYSESLGDVVDVRYNMQC